MDNKPKLVKTSLRLPEGLWRDLRLLAVQKGTTAQELVIRAIDALVKREAR
jgi:hypothetical protein